MPKIVIDGEEIEAREGQSILQAASEHNIDIPHFCYHPRLKVAGNCRMCLVEIEKVPKLQVACGTPVREGMVVSTKNERVIKARRAVLEFLLLQHPLDCPICDQCGECTLQDYCFRYGPARSRYDFPKQRFARLDIGPDLVRDQNRCIRCTRCIRFLRDVAGSEEFCLSERGGHAEVGPYLEKPVNSPFSLNLVELCPVGALTSKHFRFQGRPWLLEQVRTLCPGCSRGCNVVAWHDGQRILRLTPAHNDEVNLEWLCNPGRLTIEREQDQLCLTRESPEDAVGEALRALGGIPGERVALLVSGRLSNEDLYAVAKLAREVLGTRWLATVPAESDERPFGPRGEPLPGWFIRADKAPNSRGAQEILAAGEHVEAAELAQAIKDGQLSALLAFAADPLEELAAYDLGEALGRLDLLLAADTHSNGFTEKARLVVPLCGPFDSEGSYTNEAGRVQRVRQVLEAAGQRRPAWQLAQQLATGLQADGWSFASAAQVTAELATRVAAFAGIDLDNLGDAGIIIDTSGEQDAAETGDSHAPMVTDDAH